jgi:dephospho-CoA kinase
MYAVGLTGGIGSGKSTVADCFAALGVPVIDTDAIARDLTAPGGAALEPIRAAFGEAAMQEDGALDRAAMRRRVFADAAARHQLEAILHPRIRQVVEQALAKLAAPYALIVIPLLVQHQDRPEGERLAAYPLRVKTGAYRDVLNRVLVVDCPESLQIARVKARSGLAEDEVKAILAAQVSRDERLTAADDILLNTGSLEALHAEVARLHQRYLALAAASAP